MAVSLPLIAQKGTLPNDVLENEKNGFFIENHIELAEKIILLLNEPKKVQNMGAHSFIKTSSKVFMGSGC